MLKAKSTSEDCTHFKKTSAKQKKNKKEVSKEKLNNDGEIAKLASHLSQREPCHSLNLQP